MNLRLNGDVSVELGKNVLLFMENHNITQCLLPVKLMDYENNY